MTSTFSDRFADIPEETMKAWALKIRSKASKGVKREKGYLYFLGKDGYLWAAPMKHNKTGVKKRVGTEKVILTKKEKEVLEYCAHLR